MEPLGATASIVNLLELTVVLAKASASLYVKLKDAPKDLDSVRRQLSRISVILKEIHHLQGLKTSPTIPQDVVDSLNQGLSHTSDAILVFQDVFKDFPLSGWRARIYWASMGHRRIKRQEELLRSSKEELALLLNLLSLIDVTTSDEQTSIKVARGVLLTKMEKIEADIKALKNAQHTSHTVGASSSNRVVNKSGCLVDPVDTTSLALSSWGSWLWYHGMRCNSVRVCGRRQGIYSVCARFAIPGGDSHRPKAVTATFVLHVRSALNFNMGPKTGFAVSNLVPEDATIMLACKQGNLQQVQQLLDAGQADVTDITLSNRTPLDYAIESGNLDLVECLVLCRRSLVNQAFGLRSTSPLQSAVYERNVDMTRLLLRYRADGDHISTFGWNALFYLWVQEDHASHDGTPRSTLEFLRLFHGSGVSFDLTLRDSWGWTAVQRAAVEGKADEITAMLALSEFGMSGSQGLGPAVTDAIKSAAETGDDNIFTSLLPAYGDVDHPLENEWTLLETAAYHGHENIMKQLLRAGAEEFVLDGPCFPDLITSNALPYDLDGAAWDTERCQMYIKVLVESGKIIKQIDRNESGLEEVQYFWDTIDEPDEVH